MIKVKSSVVKDDRKNLAEIIIFKKIRGRTAIKWCKRKIENAVLFFLF